MGEALVHVVDDDAVIRYATALGLTKAGYEVRTYATGDDFLISADLTQPACLLLDLRLPGSDGITILHELSSRGSAVRTVIATGVGKVPEAVATIRAGAVNFIEKPWTDAQLLEAVTQAVNELGASGTHSSRGIADQHSEARIASLSPREREVLEAVAIHGSNIKVAEALGLSRRTVEMHRMRALRRLGVDTIAEALRMLFQAQAPQPPVSQND